MKASEIARFLGSELVGNDIDIVGVCSLKNPKDNHVAFCKHDVIPALPKKTLVLVKESLSTAVNSFIPVDDPCLAHTRFSTKHISEPDWHIQLNDISFMGSKDYYQVGGVTIHECVEWGENCYFKPGAVIGTSGFSFPGSYEKRDGNRVPVYRSHIGNVKIGDSVRIGANSIVQRGTFDSTIIGDNVKIDDLVHIAHNCNIGENTIIVSGSVICGGVTIGKNCWIGANVNLMQQITIGNNVTIGIGANVVKSVPDGATYAGFMARPLEELRK